MGNEGEKSYRTKPKIVSAFRWMGDGMYNIPAWVKTLIRDSKLNEATDKPGLVLNTLHNGTVRVPHGCWFVCHELGEHDRPESRVIIVRTDEMFKRVYEPNT